jgi:hypothetical protein
MYISKSEQTILQLLATLIDAYPNVQDRRGGESTNYDGKRYKWFETFTRDFMIDLKMSLPQKYFYVTVTDMYNSYARWLGNKTQQRQKRHPCPDPNISFDGALCITWKNELNDLDPKYFDGVRNHIIAMKSTTASGISKIMDMCPEGITTTAISADPVIIVTEHGAFDPRGLNIAEHAVGIAHLAEPQTREMLLKKIYDSPEFHKPPVALKNRPPKGFIPYEQVFRR